VLIRIKLIFAQDITDNTHSDSVDKITHRTSTRNKKKTQAQEVMIFYGE